MSDRAHRPKQQNPELERARCLADSGSLDEAATICASILRVDATSVETLHLLGVLRDAAGRGREAEALYRKAIYLDPVFHDAIMQLAFNRQRAGDLREAQMLEARARRLANNEEKLP